MALRPCWSLQQGAQPSEAPPGADTGAPKDDGPQDMEGTAENNGPPAENEPMEEEPVLA